MCKGSLTVVVFQIFFSDAKMALLVTLAVQDGIVLTLCNIDRLEYGSDKWIGDRIDRDFCLTYPYDIANFKPMEGKRLTFE